MRLRFIFDGFCPENPPPAGYVLCKCQHMPQSQRTKESVSGEVENYLWKKRIRFDFGDTVMRFFNHCPYMALSGSYGCFRIEGTGFRCDSNMRNWNQSLRLFPIQPAPWMQICSSCRKFFQLVAPNAAHNTTLRLLTPGTTTPSAFLYSPMSRRTVIFFRRACGRLPCCCGAQRDCYRLRTAGSNRYCAADMRQAGFFKTPIRLQVSI